MCRVFGASEDELDDLYEFLRRRLDDYVKVTRKDDDVWLTLIEDEEEDLEDLARLSVFDAPTSEIPPLRAQNANSRLPYSSGTIMPSVLKDQDAGLRYRLLGDKILEHVQRNGSLQIDDLPKLFFEDNLHVDPFNYSEDGNWLDLLRRLFSFPAYQELTVQNGVSHHLFAINSCFSI
ncbi:unnamed protein product [Gongylonema pulchrum]|uniref:Calpain catalytic domain-containing protein n=1 Tax=Gongylonema pulchrum TaxID=637853 RepID=A0A183E9B7_9BILA|nr:unnamed protein product [Gongylonema pulchrum]